MEKVLPQPWKSKNGKWTIVFEEKNGHVWIVATDGWTCYNGSIGYDSQVYWDKYPVKYVKEQAARMARKYLKMKRIPSNVLY